MSASRDGAQVLRLGSVRREYAWGSPTALPELLGLESDGRPCAELWFGAHPTAPSPIVRPPGDAGAGRREVDSGTAHSREQLPSDLQSAIERDPEGTLGAEVLSRFGPHLPFLLKLIAPARPLSIQVHPGRDRAHTGFARENAAGIPLDAHTRSYRDPNHKPELIYAVTRFDALSGFRAPRRAEELLVGLDSPLARRLLSILRADSSPGGVRTAFSELLDPRTRPGGPEIRELVAQCVARLGNGAQVSPSPRADSTVALLAQRFPDDPGVAVSLLLNPVTLNPGEAMFIPVGGVHAYLSGVGVELMSNSDNVLRAGLTTKHTDIPELLDAVEYVAAPPVRIAPEVVDDVSRLYRAPVDDFELCVTDLEDDRRHPLPGRGPRVVVVVRGHVRISTESGHGCEALHPGEAVFLLPADGRLEVSGPGTVVLAAVP